LKENIIENMTNLYMYILEICHGICIFEVRTAIGLKSTINSGFYLSVVME